MHAAGVVGAGTGGTLSIRGLVASEGFELVAVADLRPEALARVAEEHPSVRAFPSAEAMLGAAELDVVCVSTFAPSHEEVAEQAVAAGVKGMLLEKPIAAEWRTGRRLLDHLEARRLPVVVPHGLLVRSGPAELLERITSGEIGVVELVEIECAGWDVINAGIHWIDYALAALSGDRAVSVLAACDASTRTFRDGIEVETRAVTYVEMASGARIVMETGDDVRPARAGKGLVFRFYGSGGRAEFWGWEDRYAIGSPGRAAGELVEVASDPASPHQRYLERLAAMIAAGEASFELPELSLRALEVCEAAYLSNRTRALVRLPLEGFVPPPAVSWDPGAPYRGEGGRDGRAL